MFRPVAATVCVAVSVLVAGPISRVQAGDWPQILGPHRNGQAAGERLPDTWPEDGPKVEWSHEVGDGFAGAAVKDDQVIIFHRVGDAERIECLSADTGRQLWKTEFDASYVGRINPDSGPRCVPLIHDDLVIAYGAAGDLYCVSLADGEKRWTRATYEDFGGDEGYFGAGSSPAMVGGRVLVNVGGRGAGLAAFSPVDGKTLWKGTDEAASYSAPAADESLAVFITRLNTVAVNPANGEEVFRFPFGKRGPTVNAATPLVFDDRLFVTASYGIGARLYNIAGGKPKLLWDGDEILSSQYNTPVVHDGHLYGIHGREDIGVAELRCVNLKVGKVAWAKRGFGVAHAILADGKLLLVKNDGSLVLAKAAPDKYTQLASADLFDGTVRAMPALANGRLYVRDEQVLKCIDVSR